MIVYEGKQAFLVQALGYWGRGKTLRNAAEACFKAGATKGTRVVVELVLGDDKPAVTNHGMNLTMDKNATIIRIGKWFKLGQLLMLDKTEEEQNDDKPETDN